MFATLVVLSSPRLASQGKPFFCPPYRYPALTKYGGINQRRQPPALALSGAWQTGEEVKGR